MDPTDAPAPSAFAGPDTAAPDTAGPDTAAPDTAGPDTAGPDTAGRRVRTELTVEGMHCQSCVLLIQEVVAELDGVVAVTVDLEQARAVVVHHPDRATAGDLCAAVSGVGYRAVPRDGAAATGAC